jgi:hypothetical protein
MGGGNGDVGAGCNGRKGRGSSHGQSQEGTLKEGGVGGVVIEVTVVGPQEPRLRGQLFVLVQLVDEVHEQDRVLLMKLPHREPSNLLRQTKCYPKQIDNGLQSKNPCRSKKGTTSLINRVDHTKGQKKKNT